MLYGLFREIGLIVLGLDFNRKIYNSKNMKGIPKMSFWEKFKMSMTMTMGMDHTGLAGREMAQLMEEDIRNKFFFSLILNNTYHFIFATW